MFLYADLLPSFIYTFLYVSMYLKSNTSTSFYLAAAAALPKTPGGEYES